MEHHGQRQRDKKNRSMNYKKKQASMSNQIIYIIRDKEKYYLNLRIKEEMRHLIKS